MVTPGSEATTRALRGERTCGAQPCTLDRRSADEASGNYLGEIKRTGEDDFGTPANVHRRRDMILTQHPLSSSLSETEQVRLTASPTRWEAMFTERLGCKNLVHHPIDTSNALPWKGHPRPTSMSKWKVLHLAVDNVLETGGSQH